MQLGEKILSRRIQLTLLILQNGYHSESSWEKQLPFCIGALMYGMEDET